MNSKNSKAPMRDYSSQSGLRKGASDEHYNTTTPPVNTPVNKAETKALELLRASGYEAIQSPDWLAKKDGKWICVEVKGKALFEPGDNFPHYGIGLNKSQLHLRKQLSEEFGVRIILINFDPKTDAFYWAWLDELESKGGFYDTPKQDIRIYQLENFNVIHDAPNQNLGVELKWPV